MQFAPQVKGNPLQGTSDPRLPVDTPSPAATVTWLVGVRTDRGQVREHNEDAWLSFQLAAGHANQPARCVGLFMVGDGAGGHRAGASASQLAVRIVARELLRRVVDPLVYVSDSAPSTQPINEVLADGIGSAHWRIRRDLPQAATTLTLALALGRNIHVAHIGDTRLYRGSRIGLECLTQDHSMAERLMAVGQLLPEEAKPQRHQLYYALGQEADIVPDLAVFEAHEQDYFLLCSDGLWGQVSDEDMASIIDGADSAQDACDRLIQRANQAGGQDNATALLMARHWPPRKA
jgi:serine/threonine protein phosphatase PrpC